MWQPHRCRRSLYGGNPRRTDLQPALSCRTGSFRKKGTNSVPPRGRTPVQKQLEAGEAAAEQRWRAEVARVSTAQAALEGEDRPDPSRRALPANLASMPNS